jgi:GTP-binding protein HflX
MHPAALFVVIKWVYGRNSSLRRHPEIASVHGSTAGLKRAQKSALERLYRRKVPRGSLITPDLARHLASISKDLNRQAGLLISRDGRVTHVILGDTEGIFIPSLEDYPLGKKALRGLRLVHTHLGGEPLTDDDLTDLSLLRLDLVAAVGVDDESLSGVEIAHITPQGVDRMKVDLHHPPFDLREFAGSLEEEMMRRRGFEQEDPRERALLVSVSTAPRYELEDSMDELEELAESSDVLVLEKVVQRVKRINPRFLMGEGKLRELVISSLNKGATILIFDQDLAPSQIRTIGDMTEMKVIDRSQLILDIFARRAGSREGRVQVELAQLRYRLPRLTGRGTAMSRLMGGIGGRGPGESKLEVDRRRVRDRINLLEKQLVSLGRARKQRKQRRVSRGLPIVSIIGYTNAGKSTLLNSLTKSHTFVESRMFATLDTASRRLRFPREREVIITDTVGFIRDLPGDLIAAFKATLEELEDADLLLHVVDASNPRMEQQIGSVEAILEDLGLGEKERVQVFNKCDRLGPEEARRLAARFGAVPISALDRGTFGPLLDAVEESIWSEKLTKSQV